MINVFKNRISTKKQKLLEEVKSLMEEVKDTRKTVGTDFTITIRPWRLYSNGTIATHNWAWGYKPEQLTLEELKEVNKLIPQFYGGLREIINHEISREQD